MTGPRSPASLHGATGCPGEGCDGTCAEVPPTADAQIRTDAAANAAAGVRGGIAIARPGRAALVTHEPVVLTHEILNKATADAGMPTMDWTPVPPGCIARAVGWWWTPPMSQDTAEVQAMGRRLVAATAGLEYMAAALPLGSGVALAVGPVRP